jgi:amino acid adenylation domain-containing protein
MESFLVHHAFDLSAKVCSNKTALFFQEESISYESLYISTNQLANCLRTNGIKRGDRVSLILPKSIHSIQAILATLKSDAIYVPIDPKSPLERAGEIIDNCSPSAIICNSSTLEVVRSLLPMVSYQPKIVMLDSNENEASKQNIIGQEEILRAERDKPKYSNIDQDIAYIVYTSGSTGKPKGVAISHRNIQQYIKWAIEYFKINFEANILNTSPLHFDMSTFDIYCALQTGASLTVIPEQILMFPIRLIQIIDKRKITIWKGTSSLLSYLAKCHALNPQQMRSLRKIIFSGEPLPTKYLIEWMKAYPGKEFYNAYGPTECTGISTCYRVESLPKDPSSPVPIGKACSNKEIFALSEGGTLAKVNEVGELYIRGSCLSPGYWNDEEKTTKAFLRNPLNEDFEEKVYRTGDLVKQLADGNYVFVGRKDQQIKYRGFRIELGEIEVALQSLPYVKDGAVIFIKDAEWESSKIIGFVEADEENLDRMSEDLKRLIPKYMIPARILPLKNLPRTKNGKVDRQFLISAYLKGERIPIPPSSIQSNV